MILVIPTCQPIIIIRWKKINVYRLPTVFFLFFIHLSRMSHVISLKMFGMISNEKKKEASSWFVRSPSFGKLNLNLKLFLHEPKLWIIWSIIYLIIRRKFEMKEASSALFKRRAPTLMRTILSASDVGDL